jgi:hypothetical protein
MVGFGERKELAEGLRGVFAATSKGLAIRAAQEELARRKLYQPVPQNLLSVDRPARP